MVWILETVKGMIDGLLMDLRCLSTMWFKKIKGNSHKERLEDFYGPQAEAYDRFRANFLHGRRPLVAACAERLRRSSGMIWVDLGGGTAENVDMMGEFLDLALFDKIYVVDMCSALCKVAQEKVLRKGWSNVEIVEGDACAFRPSEDATLVTFSYSLSMIPPYMAAVDMAVSYLAKDGIFGIADFFTSNKYDLPNRQHTYVERWFWRAVFDTDGIDIGPEKRQYLEHKLVPVFELNARGKIPFVPFIQAPYYIWIGRRVKSLNNGLDTTT